MKFAYNLVLILLILLSISLTFLFNPKMTTHYFKSSGESTGGRSTGGGSHSTGSGHTEGSSGASTSSSGTHTSGGTVTGASATGASATGASATGASAAGAGAAGSEADGTGAAGVGGAARATKTGTHSTGTTTTGTYPTDGTTTDTHTGNRYSSFFMTIVGIIIFCASLLLFWYNKRRGEDVRIWKYIDNTKLMKIYSILEPHFEKIIWIIAIVISIIQIILTPAIEIDFPTFLQAFEKVLNGEFDYANIKGENGSLYYPAGYIYQFSIMYFLYTNGIYYFNFSPNGNFSRFLYIIQFLIQNYILFKIYDVLPKKYRWIKIFLVISIPLKRSIIILKYNESFAMIPLFFCIYSLMNDQKKRLYYATIYYVIAFSSKANVLLFLPGLLYLFTKIKGPLFALIQLIIIILSQFVIGLPFIIVNATNYFNYSFDFSRTFDQRTSMNWYWIPESIFVNPLFHKVLLGVHLVLLVVFLLFKWEKRWINIFKDLRLNEWSLQMQTIPLNKVFVVRVMFICNLIGIVCFRSLHFHFIIWFHGTLPFLLWSTKLNGLFKVLLMLSYEISWHHMGSYLSIVTFSVNCLILLSLLFYDQNCDKEASENEIEDGYIKSETEKKFN